MEKKLSDYLPYYMGCDCLVDGGVETIPIKLTGIAYDDCNNEWWAYFENTETAYAMLQNVKPILRPLSSMTEEEFLSLFKLSMGWYEDAQVTEFKRWSSSELYVRTGYAQYIFGFTIGLDNDVRVPQGISFFLKSYLIQPTLEVSESGIKESESYWNNQEKLLAGNQSEIFNRLRKDHFDCDQLLESCLALQQPVP